MKEQILTVAGISENQLVTIYPFGSRVYGCYLEQSDYDFHVVAEGVQSGCEFNHADLNFHVYTPDHYQAMIHEHHVGALECILLDPTLALHHSDDFEFNLDKSKLRREFSRASSNSWVKAKKKLTVENEHYIGKKSLWHSIRILMFGIQIARTGKISDYGAANNLYSKIVGSECCDWEVFKAEYQPVVNSLASEFRIVAPK